MKQKAMPKCSKARQVWYRRLGLPGKILLVVVSLSLTIASCTTFTPSDSPSVSDEAYQRITGLVCGTNSGEDCIAKVCQDREACPLVISLSNEVVFEFVDAYSRCEDCDTEVLSIGQGINKCVEYEIDNRVGRWVIGFWVSEKCNFRYGAPSRSHISVSVSKNTLQVEAITPSVSYIKDPQYCEKDSDCSCLSGSGLPFVGCRNTLYAPLHFAGDYPCKKCICRQNRCGTE